MNKLIKLYFSIFFVFMFFTFQGCSILKKETIPVSKDFTVAGMTITLTEDFTEQKVLNQTACYISTDEVVAIIKEKFEDLKIYDISSKLSAKEYADLVIQLNDFPSFAMEEDGLVSFSYDKTINGESFRYYATTFRDDDAYWLIQFASEGSSYYQHLEKFKEYAKSITFE